MAGIPVMPSEGLGSFASLVIGAMLTAVECGWEGEG